MEDKTRLQLEGQIELSQRLSSVMAHPEWPLITKLIEDEHQYHLAAAHNPKLRREGQTNDIVRALDTADALQSLLDKFNLIIKRGREAQEKLDGINGLT